MKESKTSSIIILSIQICEILVHTSKFKKKKKNDTRKEKFFDSLYRHECSLFHCFRAPFVPLFPYEKTVVLKGGCLQWPPSRKDACIVALRQLAGLNYNGIERRHLYSLCVYTHAPFSFYFTVGNTYSHNAPTQSTVLRQNADPLENVFHIVSSTKLGRTYGRV